MNDHSPNNVRVEAISACPVCNSPRRKRLCGGRDRLYGTTDERFEYVRCKACKVCYQSRRPVESDIPNCYPADYGPYQSHGGGGPGARPRSLRLASKAAKVINRPFEWRFSDPVRRLVDHIYAPPRPGAVLLDFGCGSERFLDNAKAKGWKTVGVDFVPGVIDQVRAAGHEAHLVGEDFWRGFPRASVDLIRLNHVVEHLYRPLDDLERLRTILRPGGMLHLATPNSASLTFAMMGERWFSLDCPRHIVIYSPRSLRAALLRLGFASVDCVQEVLTKDAVRSAAYWFADRGKFDPRAVMDLQNDPELGRLFYAPARIAAALGRADRFHAVARAA
ncbi:MAG TPA: class I SAM-dependent methyltransferase [Planctomycetia bacterium]|nr:class I SAM-dependent methyltransferase [Planctomycetia bacterium]